jgi:hypothetical protein
MISCGLMADRYPNILGVIEEVANGYAVTVWLRTSAGLDGARIVADQPSDTINEARGIISKHARIEAPGAALGGCASSAADITPTYVSSITYQSVTCQQLGLEAQSISTRGGTLWLPGQPANQECRCDHSAVTIFWPAAFLVGGSALRTVGIDRRSLASGETFPPADEAIF